MDEEYAKPRDVDNDLAEITSRLGDPDSTHRTNLGSVVWRLIFGILIVLVAATLHYLMWSGEVPWPRGAQRWKLWIILLGAMFIGPGIGLYLIHFAVKGLNLWVLVYPTGLFVWHRGRVISFPWYDIVALQFAGLPNKAILNRLTAGDGLPQTVWFDLSRSGRRVFGTTLTLTRTDGEQVGLPSTLADFADLGQRVQEETYRRLFPIKWAELQDSAIVSFGPIQCDRRMVRVGKKELPWKSLNSLERVADKLEVKEKNRKKARLKCDLNEIANLHVLMGIAGAMRVGPDPV